MRGVILAAGSGTRFSLGKEHLHKLLLPVRGRAVIDYTLRAFSMAGVTDVAIIIGYRGDALKRQIGDGSRQGLAIQYVYNPHYRQGNALSMYAARSFTREDPFLLSMGDHMVSSRLLARVLDFDQGANVLAVDFSSASHQTNEATRVAVNSDGRVTHIGKNLPQWNGIDAGVFRLTPTIYQSIAGLIRQRKGEYQISDAVVRMIGQGNHLDACDISGSFWHDVDTWEDLNHVRSTVPTEILWP